jgi:hypothetical protein
MSHANRMNEKGEPDGYKINLCHYRSNCGGAICRVKQLQLLENEQEWSRTSLVWLVPYKIHIKDIKIPGIFVEMHLVNKTSTATPVQCETDLYPRGLSDSVFTLKK